MGKIRPVFVRNQGGQAEVLEKRGAGIDRDFLVPGFNQEGIIAKIANLHCGFASILYPIRPSGLRQSSDGPQHFLFHEKVYGFFYSTGYPVLRASGGRNTASRGDTSVPNIRGLLGYWMPGVNRLSGEGGFSGSSPRRFRLRPCSTFKRTLPSLSRGRRCRSKSPAGQGWSGCRRR